MKTIYPLQDGLWNVDGQTVEVKAGVPVTHRNNQKADFFVSVGRASYDAPQVAGKAPEPVVEEAVVVDESPVEAAPEVQEDEPVEEKKPRRRRRKAKG